MRHMGEMGGIILSFENAHLLRDDCKALLELVGPTALSKRRLVVAVDSQPHLRVDEPSLRLK